MAMVLRGAAGIAGYARRPVGRSAGRPVSLSGTGLWPVKRVVPAPLAPQRGKSVAKRECLPPGGDSVFSARLSLSMLPPCTLPSRGSSSHADSVRRG